jgi:hypothetical protein
VEETGSEAEEMVVGVDSRFAVLMRRGEERSTRSGWTRYVRPCARDVARRSVRGLRARRDPERGDPDTPFACPNLNRVKTFSRTRIQCIGTVPRESILFSEGSKRKYGILPCFIFRKVYRYLKVTIPPRMFKDDFIDMKVINTYKEFVVKTHSENGYNNFQSTSMLKHHALY